MTPVMTIEGNFAGKFTRVHWANGKADMHPTIEKASKVVLALLGPYDGLPYDEVNPQMMFFRDFYTNPYAFHALMFATLDNITKEEGIQAPQPDPGSVT